MEAGQRERVDKGGKSMSADKQIDLFHVKAHSCELCCSVQALSEASGTSQPINKAPDGASKAFYAPGTVVLTDNNQKYQSLQINSGLSYHIQLFPELQLDSVSLEVRIFGSDPSAILTAGQKAERGR